MADRCQIPRCRAESVVTYLGHGICSAHWNQLTNENAPPDALKVVLGIATEPDLERTHMRNKKKTTQPTEQPTTTETPKTDAAAPASEKKAKPAKLSKVKKAVKPEKKKHEPKPAEELCVFALRMSPAERDALHEMAGPARASRFARTVLAAAAQGDESAFKAAIKEAKEARGSGSNICSIRLAGGDARGSLSFCSLSTSCRISTQS